MTVGVGIGVGVGEGIAVGVGVPSQGVGVGPTVAVEVKIDAGPTPMTPPGVITGSFHMLTLYTVSALRQPPNDFL